MLTLTPSTLSIKSDQAERLIVPLPPGVGGVLIVVEKTTMPTGSACQLLTFYSTDGGQTAHPSGGAGFTEDGYGYRHGTHTVQIPDGQGNNRQVTVWFIASCAMTLTVQIGVL